MESEKSANKTFSWIIGLGYLFSILTANYLTIHFKPIHLYYLIVPAGTFLIGFTFSLRDLTQHYWGNLKIWLFMITAGIITLFLNLDIALASTVSFLISETLDWLIFTKVRNKNILRRIIISNTISTPIDSVLFVWLAFAEIDWQMCLGQATVKFLSSILIIPILKKHLKEAQ